MIFCLDKLLTSYDSNAKLLFCGDFNYNVKNKPEDDFIVYMEKKWNCMLLNDVVLSTTMSSSCIDLIFFRNLSIDLQYYISYWSYHRPVRYYR